jgi:hypothetical protein
MRRLAKYYGVKDIHTSLEDCMKELEAWMERPRKEEEKIHHMPGPAFELMNGSHSSTERYMFILPRGHAREATEVF